MKFDKNKSLEKRLFGYAALAGTVITAGPTAQAAVIKTDPADQTGLKTINVDFNNDLTNDLIIRAGQQSGVARSDIRIENATGQVLGQTYSTSYTWNWYASPLNLNSTIGASKAFPPEWKAQLLMYSNRGFWSGVNEKYVGVKFKIGENTHYGWIKISCSTYDASSSYYTLSLYEYAYESTPGESIKAGADASLPVELSSFTAVPENGAVNLSWTTQNEIDNLGFMLERRLKEESDWETIASYKTHVELAGQGNKNSPTNYHFADSNVFSGNTYIYRLSDLDVNGEIHSKQEIQVKASDTVVPESTELSSAFPNPFNPFNPGTRVQYQLETDVKVTLSVVDITGRTVRTIVNENQPAGRYEIAWDGKDSYGNSTPSGVYLLVLKAGNLTKTHKVTRLR